MADDDQGDTTAPPNVRAEFLEQRQDDQRRQAAFIAGVAEGRRIAVDTAEREAELAYTEGKAAGLDELRTPLVLAVVGLAFLVGVLNGIGSTLGEVR